MNSSEIAALRSEIKADILAEIGEPLDNIWMILGGILVFFMHTGFSMLETGSIRSKNVQSILGKNLLVVCIGFISWFFLGFGFAFGETSNKFIGSNSFAGTSILNTNLMRNWFFQGAFCATAGTIVSGAMAERTNVHGFCLYTLILTTLIYPCVVHWTWSGAGFLNYPDDEGVARSFVGESTYADFAGSGIVHMVGGVGALVGAIVVGPRAGRFDSPNEFVPHNVPLVVLGTFILWFGWYGFNGASTLAMKTEADAFSSALVCMNTTLAPSVAGMVIYILRSKFIAPKSFDVCGVCNGILAGLVSITAGCGTVEPWEAIIIGAIGALVYQASSMLVAKVGIDDPVDASSVHGACGLWGVLALGFFGNPETTGGNGVLYGGSQLGVQIVAAIIIAAWVAVISIPVFLGLRLSGVLRVSDDVQLMGLDEEEHTPTKAYSMGVESPLDGVAAAAGKTGESPSPVKAVEASAAEAGPAPASTKMMSV